MLEEFEILEKEKWHFTRNNILVSEKFQKLYWVCKNTIYLADKTIYLADMARWWEKYLLKRSLIKHTCWWRDKLTVLWTLNKQAKIFLRRVSHGHYGGVCMSGKKGERGGGAGRGRVGGVYRSYVLKICSFLISLIDPLLLGTLHMISMIPYPPRWIPVHPLHWKK